MSKKTFIVFGLVVVVLAAVIPWLVFRADGDAANARPVASDLKEGQSLFQTNCGTCHTLYAAGTDGNYAPDLDELLAPSGPPEGPNAADTIKATEGRVLNAVENGVDSSTTPGRMPAGILNSTQAKQVAAFVAASAGEG
ncbi:MAG TPA: c-type cytochrome [Solirubrobacterales bacterium]|nr:c-type cytochrome [Solirubrobacterales bacterium]